MSASSAAFVDENQPVANALSGNPVAEPKLVVPASFVRSVRTADQLPTSNPFSRSVMSLKSNWPDAVSPSKAENQMSIRAMDPPK